MAYDAFISYSHGVDGQLASDLQRGLERLAKPWYRHKPFLKVVRDETTFAAASDLGERVTHALDDSDHLVLLLSEGSAASPWVDAEVRHWLDTKSKDDLTVVVTEWHGPPDELPRRSVGAAATLPDLAGFDWNGSSLPPSLRGVYEEPLVVDMRWTRTVDGPLTLADEQFADDVADVAAHVKGVNKDELIGALVAMRTRARILTGTVGLVLAILLVGGLVALLGLLAARDAEAAARDAEAAALERQAVAEEAAIESEQAAAEAAAKEAEAIRLQAAAESAQEAAEQSAADADAAAADAAQQQAAAEEARDRADELRRGAEADAATAEAARVEAEEAQRAADIARAEAEQLRLAAEAARRQAETDATAARAAAADAEQLRLEAVSAQEAAQAAQAAAEAQQRTAEALRDDALRAQANAELLAAEADRARLFEETLGDATRLANTVGTVLDGELDLAHLLAAESASAGLRASEMAAASPRQAPGGGQVLDPLLSPGPYASLVTALGHHPRMVFELTGHDHEVSSIAFTSDGRFVVAAYLIDGFDPDPDPAAWTAWSTTTGEVVTDGVTLPPACPDDAARRWNTCFAASVEGFGTVSDSGEVAATIGRSGQVALRRRPGGASDPTFPGAGTTPIGGAFEPPSTGRIDGEFPKVALSPDDRLLAATMGHRSLELNPIVSPVYLFRALDPAPLLAATVDVSQVEEVLALSGDGASAVGITSGAEPVVVPLDGGPVETLDGAVGEVRSAAMSFDGSVVALNRNGQLQVHRRGPGGHVEIEVPAIPYIEVGDKDVSVSPEGDLVALHDRCWDDPNPLIDLERFEVIGEVEAGPVAYGPRVGDDTQLLAMGWLGCGAIEFRDNFGVLDVSDRAQVENLGIVQDVESGGVISALDVSPHGLAVAATSGGRADLRQGLGIAGDDVALWVFDPIERTFERGPTLRGHARVTAIRHAPDGRVLAVGHADGTIRLWDTRSPVTPLGNPLQAHLGPVDHISWPTVDVVVSSDGERVLRWSTSVGHLTELACTRARRVLTEVEIETYLRPDTRPACG